MKNLFLTGVMLMFLGSVTAQETPKKTKQSASTSDTTITQKKTKNETHKNSAAYKTDTINHRSKISTTKPSSASTNRDSVPSSSRP
jgi:hypothetical protein